MDNPGGCTLPGGKLPYNDEMMPKPQAYDWESSTNDDFYR
jgi:hypothetical protein